MQGGPFRAAGLTAGLKGRPTIEKADVRQADNGRTALLVAAGGALVGIVSLLLENGADIGVSDNEGKTALHLATYGGPGHKDVISLLIEAGAEIDACDNNGQTALHLASRAAQHDIVSLLVRAGADTSIKDND